MSNFVVQETIEINEANKNIKYNGYLRAEIISHKLNETNCYNSVAGPQKIVNISKIKITKEKVDQVIKECFKCPICCEIYTDIVQLKVCLHSYCRKCFDTCLRTANKKCVCCRNPIETRRAATSNSTLNELIQLFVPDKEKYNSKEEDNYQQEIDQYLLTKNKTKEISDELIGGKDQMKEIKAKQISTCDDNNEINKSSSYFINANSSNSLTSSSETNVNCLGKKRVLTQENNISNNNDDENNADSNAYKAEMDILINKRPKFDIVKKQTSLNQIVNEYLNGDYAIIQIAPYNNSNESLTPFKGYV